MKANTVKSWPSAGAGLADLVRAKQLGLDVNRLLFARYLLVTKRLSDDVPPRAASKRLAA